MIYQVALMLNPATVLEYNEDGTLKKITQGEKTMECVYTGNLLTSLIKTRGATVNTKTLTYTNEILTNISEWI